MTSVSSATSAQSLNRVWHRAAPLVTSKRLAWLVIGFGAVLRGAQYFSNSSLYVDEGALALNIINRTFAGLAQPLDFNQAAPTGFLMLEKIAVLFFGNGEYALRLIPFLFSLAALLLFYAVAKRVLVAWAVPVALLFFAVSEQVIYFAAQIKQYSSDVAVTLLVLLVGLNTESKALTPRRTAILALTGIVVVWLSHPAVFVLAGAGTTVLLLALKRKQWRRFWKLAACCALWVFSFAGFYLVSLSNLAANQKLETSWMNKGTFMPLPPTSLPDLEWFVRMYFNMFSNPGDSPFPIAAGLAFIAGCIALFKKRKAHLLMLISPLLFTLLASGLHKYPFGRRLLLFSIPLMLIVIVAGVELIVERAQPYSVAVGLLILGALLFQLISGGATIPSLPRSLFFAALTGMAIIAGGVLYAMNKSRLYATVLGSVILVCLLFQPVGGVTNQLLHPPAREDIRPVMSYIKEHWQPDDVVYVYHHLRASFQYYARRYIFNPNHYVLGKDEREYWVNQENEAYARDLDQLRGKRRVWFVFSYVRSIKGVNEEDYLVRYLDGFAKRDDQFSGIGASVYLYDLSYQQPLTIIGSVNQ